MHRNLYTVSFAGVAISAAQDLFALVAHATSRIAICRIEVMQYSDVGDAASEILAYTLKRGATVAGSGGTAPTPVSIKGHTGARAAVTTARVNDTTQAGTGTIVTIKADAFNIQAGLLYAPKYGGEDEVDERITVEAGSRFVVSLDSAPADAITTSGTITFEELGLT
jgi:DNA-binding transcriptional regulator LsrR (DeoR family)